MNSVQLIESFRKEVKSHLSNKDIAFCDDIMSREDMTEEKKEKLTTKYLTRLAIKKKSYELIAETANRMDIYMSIHDCLLFSYNTSISGTLKIPEKYYAPAPADFESMLIALPNSDAVIKVQNFKKKVFCGSRRDKVGNLICIKTYFNSSKDDWRLLQDSSFIDAYYPHFSIDCPLHCDAYVETAINVPTNEKLVKSVCMGLECKMSDRRTCICEREQELNKYWGSSFLKDYYALAMMCFDKWKNRPMRSNTKKQENYDDADVSTILIQTPPEKEEKETFKEIYLRDYSNYVSTMRARGWKVRNRLSPCEHVRREHVRHLKSGKTVVVRSTVVNKGKTKAIYKV